MNRPGKFNKSAKVYVDKIKDITVLRIKGVVIPTPGKLRKKIGRLNFETNRIDFEKVHMGKKISKTIKFNNPNAEIYELKIQKKPDYISVKITPHILKPKQTGKLKITFNSKLKNEYGRVIDRIRINMTSKKNKVIGAISVITNVTEDFSKLTKKEIENAPVVQVLNKQAVFGKMKPGERKTAEIKIRNEGKRELFIRKLDVNNRLITVQNYPKKIAPGETGKIILFAHPQKDRSNLRGSIELITNDPKNSSIKLMTTGVAETVKPKKDNLAKSNPGLTKQYDIDLKKAARLIELSKLENDIIILDVRTPKEFKQGHIKGAINKDFKQKNFADLIQLMKRDKTYLVYCEKGIRSLKAVLIMKQYDFTKAYNMMDGYRRWLKFQESLPKKVQRK